MYQIIKENSDILKDIKQSSYGKILGMTNVNICNIFAGQPTKLSTVIGIISTRYNITATDEQMEGLIEKHFRKIK